MIGHANSMLFMHMDVHTRIANNILIHTDLGLYLLLIQMNIAPGSGMAYWKYLRSSNTTFDSLGFASFSEACCSVNYHSLNLSILS